MVYFIRVGSNGPIKIGKAKKPGKRLRELQASSPYRLHLIATTKNFSEGELHKRFSHLRLEGEWFTPDKELLDFIASLSTKYHPRIFERDGSGLACRLCGLSFLPDRPGDVRQHNRQHKAVANGLIPHHVGEFVKKCGWSVARGNVDQFIKRASSEHAKLAVAFSYWAQALASGVPASEFDNFMADHLNFIDAMVGGDERAIKQAEKAMKKWRQY